MQFFETVVFSRVWDFGRWTESRNPAIPGVVHRRQNPSESTSRSAIRRTAKLVSEDAVRAMCLLLAVRKLSRLYRPGALTEVSVVWYTSRKWLVLGRKPNNTTRTRRGISLFAICYHRIRHADHVAPSIGKSWH
jgi:hypothetical protein